MSWFNWRDGPHEDYYHMVPDKPLPTYREPVKSILRALETRPGTFHISGEVEIHNERVTVTRLEDPRTEFRLELRYEARAHTPEGQGILTSDADEWMFKDELRAIHNRVTKIQMARKDCKDQDVRDMLTERFKIAEEAY